MPRRGTGKPEALIMLAMFPRHGKRKSSMKLARFPRNADVSFPIRLQPIAQKRQREEWEASLAANGDDSLDDGQRDGNDASDSNGGKVAAAAITVIAVSFLAVKGAQAAKPHVEKWWRETARPKIVKTKKNVMAKFKGVSDEQGEEADPKTTEKTAD